VNFHLAQKMLSHGPTFAAAVTKPYLSDAEDAILSLIISLSPMLEQRYQEILAIISA
jgi:hypothetical protein